jgi:hypothetical protein
MRAINAIWRVLKQSLRVMNAKTPAKSLFGGRFAEVE